ncbi:hypothetical protein, variant, partial [Microbotryum lychnidis-dioicae p1A1 Lamole]
RHHHQRQGLGPVQCLRRFYSQQNTIFEISPYSFGSFNPSLSAHIPTKYMGSDAEGGKSRGGLTCVNGFDSASFIMGCSAGLFTAIESMLRPDTNTFNKILKFIRWAMRGDKQEDFLTSRVPNTFHGYKLVSGCPASLKAQKITTCTLLTEE